MKCFVTPQIFWLCYQFSLAPRVDGLQDVQNYLATLGYGLPRILAAFALVPFFSKTIFGGTIIRNGVAVSLAIVLIPMVAADEINGVAEMHNSLFVVTKEIFIGILIGYLAAIPFWAIESVGLLIDNQRGASIASTFNPLSGSEASPFGILLTQLCVTLFFVSGGMLLFLGSLYGSYVVWPIFSPLPTLHLENLDYIIDQFVFVTKYTVIMAAPIVIAMFLAEFGLGLVSRFAPQLNVFFLAMPVKSAVALAILILYLTLMMSFFNEYLAVGERILEALYQVLQ